jgi:hypothetical protein
VTLAPGAQRLLLASALFPSAPMDFRGVLEAVAPAAIAGVGVLKSTNAGGDDILTGFPALDDAAPAAASRLFAYAIDGDSYSSEWFFLNRAAAAANIEMTFTGESGERIYLPVE